MSGSSFDAIVTALQESQDARRSCQLLGKISDFGNAFGTSMRDPERFIALVRTFVMHEDSKVRGSALRVLRKFMKNKSFYSLLLGFHFEIFIARALDRDENCTLERIEALKLTRRMLLLDARCELLPRLIMTSLVAIAEVQKDPLRRVCLNTVCEVALRNPELIAHCGGIRLLLTALLQRENQEVLETLVMTLLHMLDSPDTRCYFRRHLDLEIVFSVFTNSDAHDFEYQLAAARRVIGLFLRSWVGLFCFASDPHGLRSLVEAITFPSVDIRKCCLNTLFDVFMIEESSPLGTFGGAFSIGNRKIFSAGFTEATLDQFYHRQKQTVQQNLVNNFLAMLCIAFMNVGVIDALVELGKGQDEFLADKSTELLGELLSLADKVLPTSKCVQLHSLPNLVLVAAQHSDPIVRARADRMLQSLKYISRKKGAVASNRWNHIVERVEDMKAKLDAKIDDFAFQQMLKETGVLESKDYLRWNWHTIAELLSGALTNPIRMAECTRNEWAKRFCKFYKPDKGLFASVRRSEDTINRYVSSGLKFLELLVQSDEGKEFLIGTEIFAQVAEFLTRPALEQEAASPFSRQAIRTTLASEYFTFIGMLMGVQRGREVLEKARMYSSLYPMTDMKNREDLSILLISTMTYATEIGTDHARILLSKLLTSAEKEVRYHATCYLQVLLRQRVPDFAHWGIELLVAQLYDPEPVVVEKAMGILQEVCDDEENLEALVAQRPMLLQMGTAGKYMLLRFLTSNSGFRYVKELSVLPSEILSWRDGGNMAYLTQLDESFVDVMNKSVNFGSYKMQKSRDRKPKAVIRPPHFYGALCCTKAGCALLRSSKLYPKFLQIVQNPSSLPNARRAMLWVIGSIGASEYGAQFLLESNAVPIIVELARSCGHFSVRSTCLEVIGLLSSRDVLRAELEVLGWETPRDTSLCICVARDSVHFFSYNSSEHKGSWAEVAPDTIYVDEGDSTAKEITLQVSNLSNNVIIETAAKSLRRLRTQHPDYFADPVLKFRCLKLLESFKFRLPTRRFLHDLFNFASADSETFATWDRLQAELDVIQEREQEDKRAAKASQNAAYSSPVLSMEPDTESTSPSGGEQPDSPVLSSSSFSSVGSTSPTMRIRPGTGGMDNSGIISVTSGVPVRRTTPAVKPTGFILGESRFATT